MKFHLSPDQEALQDTIQRTIERVCPPERRRALMEAGTDDDSATWTALMDAGLGGLLIPEEYGGTALGLEAAALALEIVGRTATPGPYLGHLLAGWAIAQSQDAALKAEWLPKLAAGEATGALALDGWSPDGWTLAPAGGRLTGEIRLVAGAGQAQVLVVGVQDGLAVVSSGFTAAAINGADPTRRLWTVALDAAPAHTIGSSDIGQRLVDAGLVLMAADALGGAEQMLQMSVDYAKQREQFGVVIGKFQALKHQLANMALEVEPARALVWYAAYAWDMTLPDASRVAAHAKAHLCDRFVSVARAAVQAHGGIGYTWDYDLQIWFKRSLYDRAYLGAPSQHREAGGGPGRMVTLPASWIGALRLPVIAAPMFLVSGLELTRACRRAGVVGSFPAANARTPEELEGWFDRLDADAGADLAPYAVNLTLAGDLDANAHAQVVLRRKPPILISSVGSPGPVVERVHDWGGLSFHDVVTVRHAEKAAEAGVDGIILVCGGAGGHAGVVNPFALLPQVRARFEGLIILAGAISDGRSILAAQALGADLVYMGTRFIATEESLAPPDYKAMIMAAETKDIVYTPAISGLPASFMRQSIEAAGLDPGRLPPPKGVHRPDLPEGVRAWRDVWSAGHGVGLVTDAPPVETLVERLASEYQAARSAFLDPPRLSRRAAPETD